MAPLYYRAGQYGLAVAEAKKAGGEQMQILIAQAASTISTRLRGHANAYNLIDITDDRIVVSVREWRDAMWRTKETAKSEAEPAA